MARQTKKTGPKKQKRNVPNGVAYIQSTFNNTIVTITDPNGEVISWASAGSTGFKGAKKGTPFAAQTAAENAGRRANDQGMRQIEVMVSGPGAGRETAIRALQGAGLEITLIRDITPIPHNGCRPPKRRRVCNDAFPSRTNMECRVSTGKNEFKTS
jgi:small subunit ribosomal protein S11